MGYNRIATPRAFVDLISYNLAHGRSDASSITAIQDDGSTAVTYDSGSTIEMFDMKPSNYVVIDKENQQFYIQYDTSFSTDALAESSFLAILNHNLEDANAVVTVATDDDSSFGSPTVVSTTGSHTKVINAAADAVSTDLDPASNGWTLITWDTQESNNRYLRITFTSDTNATTNFATDIMIGSILFGEIVDWSHPPQQGITTTVDYDGTSLQQSVGGSTYANSTHFGQPTWAATTPWALHTSTTQYAQSFHRRYGRLNHSMQFSHLTDTDVFAPNQHGTTASDWFDSDNLHASFYQRILGQHLPFLFTIDGSSTTEGDYGLFRLANSGFTSTQVAHRVWDVALDITETW
jgi:hypothetical protein